MLINLWNKIVEWFSDRSDRINLIRQFNKESEDAFVQGVMPTVLRASISHGEPTYRHQFSVYFGSGFRIHALSGRPLSKDEMVFIGMVVLADTMLVRRLIVLGWDTLEVHDDRSTYGCHWKLTDFAYIGKALNQGNN